MTENNDIKNSATPASMVERLVSCHAYSLYGNGLILYEKPNRDKRVFVIILSDEEKQWSAYCEDIDIIDYAYGKAVLQSNKVDLGECQCYEITGDSKIKKAMCTIDKLMNKNN